MTAICVVQARMSSSRLPAKALLPLTGSLSSIDLISMRLAKSKLIDKTIFAIPSCETSEPLLTHLRLINANYYLGSKSDLVGRILDATSAYRDCTIVRITADCPFVDPQIVDRAIQLYRDGSFDYVSTYTPASTSRYCNGSDVEVFGRSLLEDLHSRYTSDEDREHVTFPLWDGRMIVYHKQMSPPGDVDWSDVRITLDYQEDLVVIRQILQLSQNVFMPMADIVRLYRSHDLGKINGFFHFAAGW